MICRICKIDKPETNEYFSKHRRKKNGLRSACKECANTLGAEWRSKNPVWIKNYINLNPDLYDKNRETWRQRNPEKEKAKDFASNNPNKLIILSECPCAYPKKHNHHFDYSRPLEVMKLCPTCHIAEHKRLRLLAANAANDSSIPKPSLINALVPRGYNGQSDHHLGIEHQRRI